MKILIVIFTAVLLFQFEIVGVKAQETEEQDTALWLARSCIGEAGWDSYKTGECAAILHVYKKRAAMSQRTILNQAKAYSAAIKKSKRNRWVLGLNRDGNKPQLWPANIKWTTFKIDWLETVYFAHRFLAGGIVDPLPNAVHYGCKFDKPDPKAVLIKTNFRNRFYSMPRAEIIDDLEHVAAQKDEEQENDI